MKTLTYAFKKEWYNIILLLLPFLAIPFIWDQLPAQLPIHWNFRGEVDGYGSKTTALVMLPLINIGVYLLLLYLPVIDPKKRIEIDQKPIPTLRILLVILLSGIYSWIILNGVNNPLPSQSWMYLGLSAFFVVMGNYLRTIQPNYFIGIRVPWTLEDADNWKKTHRLGSYVWIAGGLFLISLFPFVELPTYTTFFAIFAILMAVIPAFYSFYLYKTSNR